MNATQTSVAVLVVSAYLRRGTLAHLIVMHAEFISQDE